MTAAKDPASWRDAEDGAGLSGLGPGEAPPQHPGVLMQLLRSRYAQGQTLSWERWSDTHFPPPRPRDEPSRACRLRKVGVSAAVR